MTPRNLFNIVLKIFGLFFLREMVITLPQLASYLLFLPGSTGSDTVLTLLLTFLIVAYFGIMVYFLVFRTDYVLDKLKLDKGFNQDEFSFHISLNKMLNIALFVIAGMILIDEVPILINYLYQYYKERGILNVFAKPEISNMIVSGVKIVIALLLIGERKRIIGLIEKKPATEQPE